KSTYKLQFPQNFKIKLSLKCGVQKTSIHYNISLSLSKHLPLSAEKTYETMMRDLQFYIFILIIIFFTACKPEVDSLEIETMQSENQALTEILKKMTAQNNQISTDYDEL